MSLKLQAPWGQETECEHPASWLYDYYLITYRPCLSILDCSTPRHAYIFISYLPCYEWHLSCNWVSVLRVRAESPSDWNRTYSTCQTCCSQKHFMKKSVRTWSKARLKSVFQNFLQVFWNILWNIATSLAPVCLSVFNDIKTICQFNTKIVAGLLEKFIYCWRDNKDKITRRSWPAHFPLGLPTAKASASVLRCYLIPRRQRNLEPWGWSRVALLWGMWFVLLLTVYRWTAHSTLKRHELQCSYCGSLAGYG